MSFAALQATFAGVFFGGIAGGSVLSFSGHDPHDLDGIADYIGERFSASGTSRHGPIIAQRKRARTAVSRAPNFKLRQLPRAGGRPSTGRIAD